MNHKEIQKRITAAQALMLEPTTTREKFTHIRNLISGIRPELDAALLKCDTELSHIEKMFAGEVIDLAAEHLPETTEEEKKRKKALLALLGFWRQLKGEVARVSAELNAPNQASTQPQGSSWVKILKGATGPLGITTLIAVAVVLTLQTTAVTLVVMNKGCATMQPVTSTSVWLPGFSLPNTPIPRGGSSTLKIPPLSITIDGTNKSYITITSLKFNANIALGNGITSVTLDETPLLGKVTTINLLERKEHVFVLECN